MAVTISPSGTLDYSGSSPFGGSGIPTTNTHLITGTNLSTTQSTGTPQVLNTPQSDYSLAFAREAQRAGQQLYGWAGNQYQYLQGLANTAIPLFLQAGANASAMANQQFGQYLNTYAPAMQRYNEMANSYSSPARQAYAMGQAEADATQAANAGWQNTVKDLQSYGIDPSSGMYAGLKSAAQTAAGASAAGAANQARQGVEQTGLGLQAQNINFGQTLPASALNAVNAQNAALSGAVNTGESTVNTGVNAYNNANNFFQTAQQLHMPVSGQGTQSSSASVGDTSQPVANVHTGTYSAKGGLIEPDDSYRRGGRVKHGGRGGGGMSGGATGKPRVPQPSFGAPTGYNTIDSDEQIRQRTGGQSSPGGQITYERSSPTPGTGLGTMNSPAPRPQRGGGLALPQQPQAGAPMDPSMPDDAQGAANVHTGTYSAKGGLIEPDGGYRRGGRVKRPHGGGRGASQGATGDPHAQSSPIPVGDGTYWNPGINGSNGPMPHPPSPPGGSITYDRSSSTPMTSSPAPRPQRGGGLTLPPQPQAGAPMDPSMPDDAQGAAKGGIPQPPGHQGRPHPPHPYHMNGLPDASTGGHVPYELSPSHGHTTDDVVANLNAGEFVLPRRTVHHLGHKFLYDIIAKSDKEMGLHPQSVGPSKIAPNSGAGKAREAAESQNFSSGGGI